MLAHVTQIQWGDFPTWVAAIGTVLAFTATSIAVWLQRAAYKQQQGQIDDERNARLADKQTEHERELADRRRVVTNALDELTQTLQSLPQQEQVGRAAPADTDLLQHAYRNLVLHHAPDSAQPLRDALRELEAWNVSMGAGHREFQPGSPITAQLDRVIDVCRDARNVLEDLLAALSHPIGTPQPSGVKWES